MSYPYKAIRINGRKIDEHRYVMEQKLGRRLKKWGQVHHKDGNKRNNDLDNLKLKTLSQHTKDHYANGDLHKLTLEDIQKSWLSRPKGIDSPWHKLTEDQVREIRKKLSDGAKARATAREYNISHVTVIRIRDGVDWKYLS